MIRFSHLFAAVLLSCVSLICVAKQFDINIVQGTGQGIDEGNTGSGSGSSSDSSSN